MFVKTRKVKNHKIKNPIISSHYAQFPDHAVEQARIQIANSHLNRIIDTLTQITDYYPVKQLKKSKKK